MSMAGFDVDQPSRTTSAASQLQQPKLATIAYRSKAIAPLSEGQLHDLLVTSQANNRRSGLTGLLIYDEGQFFQWIEGEPDHVDTMWNAIQRDQRHTNIELIGRQFVPLRFFGDWDMRLSVRSSDHFGQSASVLQASSDLIDSLFRRPQGMSGLQADLSPLAADMRAQHTWASNQNLPQGAMHGADPTLRDVIQTIVVPQLIARHNPRREVLLPVDLRVGELVRQLTCADPQAGRSLIEQFYLETHSLRKLCACLIEPAARGLGDLWRDDECEEIDVTIGLSRLQSAVRGTSAGAVPAHVTDAPTVLVVPQPGEVHVLGAMLDAQSLYQQGWQPQAEFPASDNALENMVSNTWFDALDLTLSTAFKREHWLPRVAQTIARVRAASRNPALIIIAGGRVFSETSGEIGGVDHVNSVSADATSSTASDVAPLILQSLHKLRARA